MSDNSNIRIFVGLFYYFCFPSCFQLSHDFFFFYIYKPKPCLLICLVIFTAVQMLGMKN